MTAHSRCRCVELSRLGDDQQASTRLVTRSADDVHQRRTAVRSGAAAVRQSTAAGAVQGRTRLRPATVAAAAADDTVERLEIVLATRQIVAVLARLHMARLVTVAGVCRRRL